MNGSGYFRGHYLQRALLSPPVGYQLELRRSIRTVSTLDPQSLCSADALDLSSAQSAFVQLPSGRSKIRYQRNNNGPSGKHVPFPDKTVGFLYFHAPSCSLRFRIVPSGLPGDFEAGHDLCARDGAVTWGQRAASLARGRHTEALRQQLLDEGLIDSPALQSKARTTTTLHRQEISDRDLLDFSDCSRDAGVWLVRPNGIRVRLSICYGRTNGAVKFSSGTRGFLYYHAPTNPYDGAIRLRLAERAAEFDDASDLRHPVFDAAWGIELERIATHRYMEKIQHEKLCDYLVQKKLVPQEIVRHTRMVRSVARLRDVFFVNFRKSCIRIELRGHGGARAHLTFRFAFRARDSKIAAYDGAALAHLVIVATTDTTIQLGLRIYKLLHGPHKLIEEAADGRSVFLPSEGAMVPRYTTGRPVSTRIKKDSAAGRILLQMMEQEGGDERAGAQ